MVGIQPGRDKYFVWGVVLVVAGYLVSLNPYWWIFGTPLIFLSGIAVLFLSKSKVLTKVLFSVLPVILWLPGFWLLIYFGSAHMSPETFLIPQNFRGKITLYYGEPCGQELKKENGRYVYRIPQSGVMVIKNPFEAGLIDQEYYFVDKYGIKISRLAMGDLLDFNGQNSTEKNKRKPLGNKIFVFLGGTGNGSEGGTVFNFHEMYVSTGDSLEVFNDKKADSLSKAFLVNCRASR
ncbi:MAG: hypothetical protein ABI113_20810 [Mucilaginibacter sp.]